jgi:hypothetical protein
MPIPQCERTHHALPLHLGDLRKRADMSPYLATVTEICKRFGTSLYRKAILQAFLLLRKEVLFPGVSGDTWSMSAFLRQDVSFAQ